MIAIGFGIAWLGYALSFYGFSLVKGYDLSLRDVISPSGYYKGSWPPPAAPDDQVFPNATGPSSTSPASKTKKKGQTPPPVTAV